jgi:hypothetical protein
MPNSEAISINQIKKSMKETPAVRFPFPAAFADPAFVKCVEEGISEPEFVTNYDRLYKRNLSRVIKASPIEQMVDKATGFQQAEFRMFSEFVHSCVYLRLPDDAIHALRLADAVNKSNSTEEHDDGN